MIYEVRYSMSPATKKFSHPRTESWSIHRGTELELSGKIKTVSQKRQNLTRGSGFRAFLILSFSSSYFFHGVCAADANKVRESKKENFKRPLYIRLTSLFTICVTIIL